MKKGPSESPEHLKPLDVVVINPAGDKYFMVGFGNTAETYRYTKEQRDAYNYAIENVLEEAGLQVFHQVGADEKQGTQMWEIWTRNIGRDYLIDLLPSIHQKAEEYIEELSKPL